MVDVKYYIVEKTLTIEGETRSSYGIAAYASNDRTNIVKVVHDISFDRSKVYSMIKLFNKLSLSTIHLVDVVNDMIE